MEDRGRLVDPDDVPRLVDLLPRAIDQIDVTILGEGLPHEGEGARQEQIIGVEPPEDLAGRALEAAADGRRLPAVRAALPVRQAIGIAPDDVDAAVLAAAVHEDVLEIRVSLVEDRTNRRFDVRALIEGGGDDRDAGRRHGGVPRRASLATATNRSA
jgi:hypothetical protein